METNCVNTSPVAVANGGPPEERRSVVVKKPPMKQRKGLERVKAIMVFYTEYLLTCFLSFFLLPPLFVLMAILRLGKWLFDLFVKYSRDCIPFREDDAVWLQDVPTNRHIIHALMMVEGTPKLEKLREVVAERLVFAKNEKRQKICPRLTQLIENHFGRFVWKEADEFNVDNHVKHWEGEMPKSLEELQRVISDICSTTLPDGIPPWQFLVIPTSLESDVFALVLRMHHSMADGVALTRVFVKNLFDIPPQGKEPHKFTMQQRAYMWCKAAFIGIFLVLTKLLAKADNSPVHGQELSGKKLVSWSRNFDLTLVKQIKNITGTTVNDVMVSCVAGALNDYLIQHCSVVNPRDILASVPVDIRSSSKSLKLQNKFALVFLKLPLSAKCCIDRLFATKRRMDVIKKSAEPLVTATTVKLLMMLPQFISKPMIDFFSMKMSCVLSNVPGPLQILSIGGQRVVEGIFWPPQRANIGIGLSIFSYGGGIRFGIFSDENVISDPRVVVEAFEKQFEQLVHELDINDNK